MSVRRRYTKCPVEMCRMAFRLESFQPQREPSNEQKEQKEQEEQKEQKEQKQLEVEEHPKTYLVIVSRMYSLRYHTYGIWLLETVQILFY